MTKYKKIGQTAEYSVYSHQSNNGVFSCIMQLLLLYFAVLGTVLCVSTSLAMTVPVVEIVLLCLFTTTLFAGVFFNKITTLVSLGAGVVGALVFLEPLRTFFDTLYDAVLFCYDLAFVLMKMAGWNYTSRMITSEENIAALLENEELVLSYFRHIVIVLAVFYALWFVMLSWKKPRVWPTIIVSLAVLVPGFTIGLVPSSVAFSMLLAAAFGLYMQTLPSRHMDKTPLKERIKAIFGKQSAAGRFAYTLKSGLYGVCTAAVSFVAMLIIALVTMRTPLIELDEVRQYLDEGSRYIYNQMFYARLETPDNAIGSMLDGDTIDVLKIPNIHKVPVYYMTSDENQTVYLRAWVTDLWTDEGWKVLDESTDKDYQKTVTEGTNPYAFAYQLQNVFEPERLDLEGSAQESYGFVTDTITLKARFSKSLMAHLPSYGAGELPQALVGENIVAGELITFDGNRPVGNTYDVEAFIPVVTSKGYVAALHGLAGKYTTLLTTNTSDIESEKYHTFVEQERSYYTYAKKHFLNTSGIPESFADKAHELSDKYESQLAKVLSIEKYFRNSAEFTYTLSPVRVQNAAALEQVEYSLFTEKEGYCTYYATAMTMMVRTLGYPARFVNGYYVRETDKEENGDGEYKRTVMDSSAHAWVEVYFEGLGWMTFDPTPDAAETAGEYNDRYYALQLEDGEGEGGGSGAAAIQSVTQIVDVEPQPEDNEVMPELEVDYGIFGGAGLRVLILILVCILVVLALAFVLMLIIKAHSHSKARYLSVDDLDEDGNEPDYMLKGHRMLVNILRWLELCKMERHTDETLLSYAERMDQWLQTENSFAEIAPILQKCEFSDGEIIESQYWQARLYYDELYRLLYQQKGKPKLSWYKKLKV